MSSQSVRGRGMGAYTEDGAARQPFVANLIDFRHSVVQAHKRADAGDESLEICPYCMCEVDVDPQPHRPGCAGIGGARATSSPVLAGLDPLSHSPAPKPSVVPGSARNGLDALARMDDGLPQEPELELDVDEPDAEVLEEREPEVPVEPTSAPPAIEPPVAPSRSSSTNPYGLVKFGRGYIWTKPAALEAVRAFVAEHGRPPQNADAVAPTVGMFPSPKSVTQLFGSFDAMVVAAGFEPAARRVRDSSPSLVARPRKMSASPAPRERPVTSGNDTDEPRDKPEIAHVDGQFDASGSATSDEVPKAEVRDLTAVRAAAHKLVDAILEALA